MKKHLFKRQYIINKRAKYGPCNICQRNDQLTWDHVPPKGGIGLAAVEMERIFDTFRGKPEKRAVGLSQNGVKYRTICRDCNGRRLKVYDGVINSFALSVGRYFKSNLVFTRVVHHRTKPVALMRAILGHLLSAKIEIDNAVFDKQIREVILDERKAVPQDIYIFYWLYPYRYSMTIRDLVMPARRGDRSQAGGFHVLKYFPVAYLVSQNVPEYEGLYELTKYRNLSIDEEIEIPIQLNRVEHPRWPEIVDDGNILLLTKSTKNGIVAQPRIV